MELSTLRRLTTIMRDNLISRVTDDKTNYLVNKLFPTFQLKINIMRANINTSINEKSALRHFFLTFCSTTLKIFEHYIFTVQAGLIAAS